VTQTAQADVHVVPVQAAVQGLYERHGARVLAYCRRRLRSEEEAEDALQTTFLYAFRGLQRGVVPETEIAWLLKIAHNVCLSTWDSDRRRQRLELVQDPEQLQTVTPAAPSGHENAIALETALGDLTELQRRAILLREWRGLSYQEIAQELELSQSAVETLIFRARRTLARSLERQDVDRPRTLARCLDFGGLLSALKSALGLGGSAKLAAGLVGVAVLAGSIPDAAERPAPERPKVAPPAQVSAPVAAAVVVVDPATSPAARAAAEQAKQDRRPAAKGQRPERKQGKKGSQPGETIQVPAVSETVDETVKGVTDTVNETVRGVRETVDETVPEVPEILPPVLDLVDGVVGGDGGLLP
jgi:RNA polymerase sigma-70 factor (ECF subfamily)